MNKVHALVFSMMMLLVGASGLVVSDTQTLPPDQAPMNQFGGDTSFEAQCSKSSFEDVFTYTWANFDVTVADNWRTAQIQAVAWVNGTMADDFRAFLDDLLDGLIPSGGDGWLSSDEREAVRAVAADCVEYTMTRVGVRDGEHHRGGPAVDWRNATWVEDGVSIDEWNMVPERHESVRSCTSFGSSDCYEVPVSPGDARDCDTDVVNVDECRIELMLLGTVDLHNIQSLETLTLAMNTSNISRATYTVTAPYVEGMRVSLFEECEGRDLLHGGTATPLRGSCIGDGSSVATFAYNELGGLVLTIMPDRPNSFWPAGEDLFFDLTTIPPSVDEFPIWTPIAPENGTTWLFSTKFSSSDPTSIVIGEWSEVAAWFSDEDAVSTLDLFCYEEESESNLVTESRSIVITIGRDVDFTTVACSAVDAAGQSTPTRHFHVMRGFLVNTPSNSSDVHDNLELVFTNITTTHPTNQVLLDVEVVVGLEWGGDGPTYYDEVVTLGQDNPSQEIFFSGDARIATPGPLNVWFKYSGTGVYERIEKSDIFLQKIGSPPILSILESRWTGTEWVMNGMFSDPDGEDVTFTMFINGENVGSVQSTGNSWSVGPIDFQLFEPGAYTVTVQGCDSSGMCSISERSLNSTSALYQPPLGESPEDGEDSGTGFVPFPLYSSFMGILAAAFMYGRGHRKEQ